MREKERRIMERQYVDNPSLKEKRTAQDLFNTFSKSEQIAVTSMTNEERHYLRYDCYIDDYIKHLRAGASNKAMGSDYPILVAKGNKLQLARFKLMFLICLLDYQGLQVYHPADFQLGRISYEEAQDFPGVVIINIPYGSSTTEGFDQFRSDLITDVLTIRRENFNPTIVLMEETISGRLGTPSELIKYVRLDPDKLSGSYDGTKVQISEVSSSRKKAESKPYYDNSIHVFKKEEEKEYKSEYKREKFKPRKKTNSRGVSNRIER